MNSQLCFAEGLYWSDEEEDALMPGTRPFVGWLVTRRWEASLPPEPPAPPGISVGCPQRCARAVGRVLFYA